MSWIAPLLLAVLAAGPQTPASGTEVVVYFDRNSAQMGQTGLDIIDSTYRLLGAGNGGLLVAGHTSTLGDDAANLGLAERRAAAVRNALLARGIASRRITTTAMGESAPARPTADGVDEPLNDRVVIRVQ